MMEVIVALEQRTFERRRHRYVRLSIALAVCCGLSVAALVFWLVPIYELRRETAPALTLVLMDLFTLSAAATGVGAGAAHWWRRRFERRGQVSEPA